MAPPTNSSHPEFRKSSGVQFQSPPISHGPQTPASSLAMSCKRSRLRREFTPIVSCKYTDPKWKPPLQTAPTRRKENLLGCAQGMVKT